MNVTKEMIEAGANAFDGILGLSREEAAAFILTAALSSCDVTEEPVAWMVTGSRTFKDSVWATKIGAQGILDQRKDGSVLIPLYASPLVEPVAVKALVWSEHEQSTAAGDHCAKTPFGDYEIGLPHLYWIVVMPNGVVSDGFDTIKEAKAAAQADYETRVLSALARPLPIPSEEKMREALEKIAELERHVEKLQDVVKAECACSYDRPDDVCLFHAKMKVDARASALEEAAKLIEEGFDRGIARKVDTCAHGKYGWEDCGSCAAVAIRALSSTEHGKVTE